MDYEERYKKALGEARKFYSSSVASPARKQMIAAIFPELADSEDKRIRMCLLDFIKSNSATPLALYEEFTPQQYISYLEKQKDSKWSPSEDEMGVLYKLCYISKQVADEDDAALTRLYQDLKREYFNGHSFENMFPSEKQKERKPAGWDGSDEYALKYLLELIDFGCSNNFFDAQTAADMRVWLRSKLIFGPVKQEWSEEDESNLQSCIAKIEIDMQRWDNHGKTMVDGDIKLIDWLKSRRPVKKGLGEADVEAMVKEFSDNLPLCGEFQTYHDALVHTYRQGVEATLNALRPNPRQAEEE